PAAQKAEQRLALALVGEPEQLNASAAAELTNVLHRGDSAAACGVQIEYHQVDFLIAQEFHGLFLVGCEADMMSRTGQDDIQHRTNQGTTLNYQQMGHTTLHPKIITVP